MRLTREQVSALLGAADAVERLDEALEPDALQSQVCVDPDDVEQAVAGFRFLLGVANSLQLLRDPLP